MPTYSSLLSFLNVLMEWVIDNYIIVSVALAIIVAVVFVLIQRRSGSKETPQKQKSVSSGDAAQKRETLMGIVRELETKVDKIDIENSRESERKWYNKVKLQMENIKRSIDGGELHKAKRHLNDAELYMKMLELNSASSE
jgi:hypothetical protein